MFPHLSARTCKISQCERMKDIKTISGVDVKDIRNRCPNRTGGRGRGGGGLALWVLQFWVIYQMVLKPQHLRADHVSDSEESSLPKYMYGCVLNPALHDTAVRKDYLENRAI